MLNKFYVWVDKFANDWSRKSRIIDEITTYHFLPGCHHNKVLFDRLSHLSHRRTPTGLYATISTDGHVMVSSYYNQNHIKSLLVDPYLLKNKDEIKQFLCLTEVKYVGFGFCRIKYQYGLMGSLVLSTKRRIHV